MILELPQWSFLFIRKALSSYETHTKKKVPNTLERRLLGFLGGVSQESDKVI